MFVKTLNLSTQKHKCNNKITAKYIRKLETLLWKIVYFVSFIIIKY